MTKEAALKRIEELKPQEKALWAASQQADAAAKAATQAWLIPYGEMKNLDQFVAMLDPNWTPKQPGA